MMNLDDCCYSPALRFKQGECDATSALHKSVMSRIIPRFVLPPPKQKDVELHRILSKDEFLHLTGKRIGQHWPLRPCMIEPRFLFKPFGDDDSAVWLPRLFKAARSKNAWPIPLASLSELLGPRGSAFKLCLERDLLPSLAVRVLSADVDEQLAGRVQAAMNKLDLKTSNCICVVDFCDADFSQPNAIADFLVGALDVIQRAGKWTKIVYQGTNFPVKNPASENSSCEVARNEWLSWLAARTLDNDVAARVMFGDYGADNSQFVFKGGSAKPFRHLRHCRKDSWLVVRGSQTSDCGTSMHEVCKRIIAAGEFPGAEFSFGDQFIARMSEGVSNPGSPTTWRTANMNHHMTHVVAAIGGLVGFRIGSLAVGQKEHQNELPI